MKNLFPLLAAWALPLLLHSQTLEIEKKGLNDLITSGKIPQTETMQVGRAWQELLAEFGGYPELPYNPETEKVEFMTVFEFPGATKEMLMRRIEEWVAINYGSIEDVLHYKNPESGKLIVKGFLQMPYEEGEYDWFLTKRLLVRDARCYNTAVFTVKPGKVKVEHRDMEFRYRTEGYAAGSVYIPSENVEVDMDDLYPVTLGDKKTWKSRLRTIKNVNEEVQAQHISLKKYIQEAEKYDSF